MRRLEIHSVRAVNIRCFGPKGIELHFKDYGNLVQIKGINLDAPGTEYEPASNGAGKSSIQELLTIGFFGKAVKNPTKNHANQIMNVLAEKAEVEIQWDDCRLVRKFTRTKTGSISSKLEVWENPQRIWDKPLDLSGIEPTQAFIDEKIGLSHRAFCNLAIFDDSDAYAFLQSDLEEKRLLAENLLDLDQYRIYLKNAKDLLKELKKKIELATREYSKSQDDLDASEKRLLTLTEQQVNWRKSKKSELAQFEQKLVVEQNNLKSINESAELLKWQKAQDRIAGLQAESDDLTQKRNALVLAIEAGRKKLDSAREEKNEISQKLQTHLMELGNAQSELARAEKGIGDLENLKDGTKCPTCHGTVHRENCQHIIEHGRTTIGKCEKIIAHHERLSQAEKEAFAKKSAAIGKMEDKLTEADGKVKTIDAKARQNQAEMSQLSKVPRPDPAVAKMAEDKVVALKKDIEFKQRELEASPYKELLEQTETETKAKRAEKEVKSQEFQDLESEVPYLEYWIEAFGDNGIRKYVIDDIMPTLNDRIAYWLQILIDGLIDLKFDSTFKETITRNQNPASYHAMSKGELRRINLSIPQAFAYVTMLNAGCCPNILFLDEITGGGIDRAGIPYVYNMIQELAKERQVFVTTHNEHLMNLLQGCEAITLKKQDDITVLV